MSDGFGDSYGGDTYKNVQILNFFFNFRICNLYKIGDNSVVNRATKEVEVSDDTDFIIFQNYLKHLKNLPAPPWPMGEMLR